MIGVALGLYVFLAVCMLVQLHGIERDLGSLDATLDALRLRLEAGK